MFRYRSSRVVLALILMVAAMAPLPARAITLFNFTGYVRDPIARPISGASVKDQYGHTAVTDNLGRYTLPESDTGTYTLRATKLGMYDSPAVAAPQPLYSLASLGRPTHAAQFAKFDRDVERTYNVDCPENTGERATDRRVHTMPSYDDPPGGGGWVATTKAFHGWVDSNDCAWISVSGFLHGTYLLAHPNYDPLGKGIAQPSPHKTIFDQHQWHCNWSFNPALGLPPSASISWSSNCADTSVAKYILPTQYNW